MSLDTLETFPADSERSGLGALSRASLVFAVGGLAYKGVALVTIPILARLLSPAELGLLDLAAVVASAAGLAAVLGTDQAVAYFESRTSSAAELWGSAIAIVVVGGCALAAVATVAQGPIAQALTGSADNGAVIAAAGLYGAVLGLSATGLNAARLRGTPRAYAIVSFALVTAEMALALAIAWLGIGSVALMVVGWAAGAALVLAVVLARFLPRLRIPRAETVRRLATYGAPLVPAGIAWVIGDALIRGALAREVDAAALGEYGIAYRVASVLGLAVTGFGVAWYPYLYRSPPAAVVGRAAQALGVLVIILAAIGVAITALSPEIIAIVAGPAYAGARDAVAPLAGGMVALGAFILIGAVAGSSGSTRRIAVAAVAGAAIQVVATVMLVEQLGLVGAALSSLVGYVAAAAILGASEHRVLLGHAPVALVGVLVVAAGGLMAAAALASAELGIRLAFVLAFIAVAALLAQRLGLGRGLR